MLRLALYFSALNISLFLCVLIHPQPPSAFLSLFFAPLQRVFYFIFCYVMSNNRLLPEHALIFSCSLLYFFLSEIQIMTMIRKFFVVYA